MNGDGGVVALVGVERGDSGSCVGGVVVGEFRKRKEGVPVVLLIVDVGAEKLFKGLINSFSLSVSFRVITGGEMEGHV